MVYGLARAPVAAEHLLGVHSAVRFQPAARVRLLRRGLIVSGAGVLVTAVTLLFMPEDRVVFGVLTLLGAAMLITGLLQPLLQKIPAWAGLVVSLLLFAATYHTQDGFWQLGPWQMLLPGAWYANLFTAFFGFFPRGFFSTDYFPLLPWLFLFWAGYFLHFCMGRAPHERCAGRSVRRWAGWADTRWGSICCISR